MPLSECGVLELAEVRYSPGFGFKYFKLLVNGGSLHRFF